jgi:hypothetical protein
VIAHQREQPRTLDPTSPQLFRLTFVCFPTLGRRAQPSPLSFVEFMAKVRLCWLPKWWQQDLARKVQSTKQNKTAFSDFIDALHCDNLLLKGSQFHLSPPPNYGLRLSPISPQSLPRHSTVGRIITSHPMRNLKRKTTPRSTLLPWWVLL